jgi:hypothetical protein
VIVTAVHVMERAAAMASWWGLGAATRKPYRIATAFVGV